ncbi:MAG: hypothetical protein IKV68_04280 [Oscillospiraceae bacterium]|nr:hypothetical protein [Oscillospiraceae bacterium]
MHDFHYVSKSTAQPIKAELYEILYEVQDLVRDYFTFQFTPVGSSTRNMITRDAKSNIGFDFDINIEVNAAKEAFDAKEIRTRLRNAIDLVAPRYGYKCCEDSTRVLTIKTVNTFTSQILHSCDFAVVHNCEDGKQQYIRFNKKQNSYFWAFQSKSFTELGRRIDWLKKNDLWGELREYYIFKKNNNDNPDKHSRSIFAESINEMCRKYGYRN